MWVGPSVTAEIKDMEKGNIAYSLLVIILPGKLIYLVAMASLC